MAGNFENFENPKNFTEKCQKNIDLGPKKTLFSILRGSGTPLRLWDLKFPVQFAKNYVLRCPGDRVMKVLKVPKIP